MTRLLKTPIIGPSANTVDSSRIDMLAGLSGSYILRIPPGFWAQAGGTPSVAMTIAAAVVIARRFPFIRQTSLAFACPFAGSFGRLQIGNTTDVGDAQYEA